MTQLGDYQIKGAVNKGHPLSLIVVEASLTKKHSKQLDARIVL